MSTIKRFAITIIDLYALLQLVDLYFFRRIINGDILTQAEVDLYDVIKLCLYGRSVQASEEGSCTTP